MTGRHWNFGEKPRIERIGDVENCEGVGVRLAEVQIFDDRHEREIGAGNLIIRNEREMRQQRDRARSRIGEDKRRWSALQNCSRKKSAI